MNTFNTCLGTNSESQNFTVSGSNLTDDILVDSLTGYEYSLDNSIYSFIVTLTGIVGKFKNSQIAKFKIT